mmetsp:Transcript_123050/g.309682  ORF Transcript_123050/g.309682 Transcript_123050/m.309682 type:complete len:259 (-) Transcript_123050:421-1197(-)
MWTVAPKKQSFAFVFPQWVGHLNPSLPIARRLRELGHEVHYVCHEFVRDKIEATGATFHSAVGCHPELYNGRGGDFFSMFANLKEEFGVEPERTGVALWQLRNVMVELQLPGLLRLFRDLKPDAVFARRWCRCGGCWSPKHRPEHVRGPRCFDNRRERVFGGREGDARRPRQHSSDMGTQPRGHSPLAEEVRGQAGGRHAGCFGLLGGHRVGSCDLDHHIGRAPGSHEPRAGSGLQQGGCHLRCSGSFAGQRWRLASA